MKKLLIIMLYLSLSQFLCGNILHADVMKSASLYSYTGYLTIPSAYIVDGQLGFHYSYFPKDVAAFHKGISDNHIYSASLGFLPFMECFFSVYATPSIRGPYNYGSNNTRSPGVKFKIFNEKKYIPSVAFGIFDPNLNDLGADFTWGHISSTFLVLSKKLDKRDSSVSIGYGLKTFKGEHTRLNGLFGGINIFLLKNISFVIDYDTERWSEGISTQWHGFDMTLAFVGNSFPIYRMGYTFNLFDVK